MQHPVTCFLKCCAACALQKKALERVSELENENAVLKEAADRRSKVLHQSRSFINAYLQARLSLPALAANLEVLF